MNTRIVWFRNDLRMHDHPALHAAIAEADQIIPLFVLDRTLLHGKHASANRTRFLLESLHDVRKSLRGAGADLIVREGKPAAVLAELAEQYDVRSIHYTIDYSPYARTRDAHVTEQLAHKHIELIAYPGRLAVDTFQGLTTGSGNVYKVFTPFWKTWSRIPRREVLEAPAAVQLPGTIEPGEIPRIEQVCNAADLAPDVIPGGETAGLERLHDFMDTGVHEYAEMHDTLTPGGTSRLSAYLHMGCISVRQIEAMLPPGDGPARYHRQLAWRDFYYYVLFHFPDNATQEFQERFRDLEWLDATSPAGSKLLLAWQQGRTGYPIIDAAMRQLLREGWMHNRARLITGSFLTKDLAVDWRAGERWFMQHLIDGDEANNNGNWQWIASVGVDPAPIFRRLYNPTTQQKRYDSDGSYVRYYVPELSKLTDSQLLEPWKMSPEEQQRAGCILGQDYPEPVVDHAEARLASLDRYRR